MKIQESVKKAREASKERKFPQSFDLVINLKDLNIKNPNDQVDFYISLDSGTGKKQKICAFVAQELADEAKKICDTVILQDDFPNYDKKKIKKLAADHAFFIAQANIMAKVASSFGRVLGPRQKMPNPKAGCVVPPKGNLQPLYDRLQKTIRVIAKKEPNVHIRVGSETQDDESISKNISQVYNQLVHHLPKEKHNVRGGHLKLTMGKPVKIKFE